MASLLWIDPAGLHAQEASSVFGEVVDVRVTSIDVVATDSKGNPVPGLTRADFQIFEDGKPQEITNFSEVTSTSTQAEVPATPGQPAQAFVRPAAASRRYIFYIDNSTLSVKNRNEIFPAVEKFLADQVTAGDQVMIVSWNGSLQIRLPWTGDRAAIQTTLKTLSGELGGAGQLYAQKMRVERMLHQLEAEAGDPKNMVTYEGVQADVRSYAEATRHDVAMSINGMVKLLTSLAGVEGKKVLVMATESLPTQAGAEMFQVLENIRSRAAISTTSSLADGARRASPIGDLGKYNMSPMVETLARAANAAGVTVYAINPQGTDNDNSGKVELQQPGEESSTFTASMQALDGVKILAGRTGGSAMVGASAATALQRLTADLSSYYSIGFRTHAGSTPDRKVEVRSKREGVRVRYRTSIYYRSIETEMTDRVIANHLQSQVSNELGISLQTDPVTTEGSRRLLPMRVVIPTDSLTLSPDAQGNMTGGFSVFTSAGDTKGGASGVNVQTHKIVWPAAQAAQMKGRRIGFAVQIPMDKNPKQISVGVVDMVSQTEGFATVPVPAN